MGGYKANRKGQTLRGVYEMIFGKYIASNLIRDVNKFINKIFAGLYPIVLRLCEEFFRLALKLLFFISSTIL